MNGVASELLNAASLYQGLALATAAFLTSIALTVAAVLLLRRSWFADSTLDQPNHRSLHDWPTPRIGGVAMAIAVAIVIAALKPDGLPMLPLVLAAGLTLVSLLDDRRNLPVASRLALQLAAATWASIGWIEPSAAAPAAAGSHATFAWLMTPWGVAASILTICWVTNLFNFMDGANGMAGGMAFIGFGAYAIAAAGAPAQGLGIAAVAAALSGAALGFLFFNIPVARIFMGDAGAVPIGFLAAALGIHGNVMGLWAWWFGVLVFSPFIVDATVTLFKRFLRHEKIWIAHREHYYQRLILSGWSHRKTVNSYYLLMLGSAISALAAQNGHFLYLIATFWVITYVSLLLYLEWRFYRNKKDKTEENPGVK